MIRAIDQPGCEDCERILENAGRDYAGACDECTAAGLNLGKTFWAEFTETRNLARSKDQRNE